MFGLPEQIGRAEFGIDGVVRDHHRLGRPGKEVDTDAAEELAFGFGDKSVAGADNHVHGVDRLRSQSHRPDRLHATQNINFMRAAQVHGRDNRGMRLAVSGRSRSDDARHAGDGGGQHGHVGRGHHRKLATRHVAADGRHGDVPVAEDHAGERFDLEIRQGGTLRFRKTSDLSLGELNISKVAGRDFRHRLFNFRRAQSEAGRVVSVELDGEFPHGVITTGGDVREGAFNNTPHLGVVFGALGFGLAGFQIGDGHGVGRIRFFLSCFQARFSFTFSPAAGYR